VRNVSKHFSGIPAVDNVSFLARPGEVTGSLGPNGSGNSTMMKMIPCLIKPTIGQIPFDRAPILADPVAFKQRIGYLPEEPYLYHHLSGAEYLTMISELRDLRRRQGQERIEGRLHLFSLHGNRHASIQGYSKGMRQKLLLIASLLHNPNLLLLDEPFSGLDVSSALILRALIEELARRDKVVLFSSHELDTAGTTADRFRA
jgi:ABC-2 type transport system ATP-binding protein